MSLIGMMTSAFGKTNCPDHKLAMSGALPAMPAVRKRLEGGIGIRLDDQLNRYAGVGCFEALDRLGDVPLVLGKLLLVGTDEAIPSR